MVLRRSNQPRTMATKAPIRSAESPSYAVSLCVVSSHSPVVVRRAIKTPTDATQVILFSVFALEVARLTR